MAFNIFGKNKNKKEEKKPTTEVQEEIVQKESIPFNVSHGAHAVILSFYTSEKSSRLMGNNQYVFKVARTANKQEVRKHVSALYKVDVINVQMLNMPEKERRVGRHSGVKAGFRKAIVTLTKGQSIEQARP
jgi:large subunit ribosomal protein L23